MTGGDPFGLGAPPVAAKPSALLTGLKNIGMFFAALIVTVTIASFFKSAMASTDGRAAGRYYLETTAALRVGDVLSPTNTIWRSGAGKRGAGLLTSDTKGADVYYGWQVLSPVRAGQPVEKTAVVDARPAEQTLMVPQGKVGFVLAGDELAALTDVLRPGAHVDVIAVSGGARSNTTTSSVATLVQDARVLHVRAGLKRGGRGMDASVTLAVSPEEAEDMAAWRRNGALVLTLTGPQSADPSRLGQWRALYEDETDTTEQAVAPPSAQVATGAGLPPAPVAVAPPGIAVITPSGARRQALP